jgi:RNA polymerase subunit RPABC4/transcription elongation factor Spt4
MKICQNCSSEIQDTFNFCPICGSDLGKPITCKNCHYENEPNSKFCQECGIALFEKFTKKEIKPKEPKIRNIEIPEPSKNGITIEFPFTTAQSFDFAIREAKKFETFEQFGEDKKAIYRVTFSENDLYKAKDFLEHLKGWRKRTVYNNGEKVQWDSVFGFTWCYERKLSSFKPEYYCFGYENEWDFNIWGCMRATMPFTENSQWFTYGKWLNNNGDWEFDKERIKHELTKNLYPYRYCPALNPSLIQDVIDALPNVVNPKKNKNWKFIESYTVENNALVIKINEYGFEQTRYLKGVGPNGKAFLKDITDNIKRKLPDFIKPK